NMLVTHLSAIRHLPATLIHGRFDLVCPVGSAYALHRLWPEAELKIVENAGHSSSSPAMASMLIAATERFKEILAGVATR
ncbi:MAG: prolyl aminopeptidase, partial [Burkholderiales bacterium]